MSNTDINIDNLPDDINKLKEMIIGLKSDNIRLSETIKIYQFKLFGRKSEKLPKEENPGLFNESEMEENEIGSKQPAEKIRITYERLKKPDRGSSNNRGR